MTKGLKIINSLSVASLMGIVGLSYAINRSCNNQTINKPGYSCYSETRGLGGHTEYIKYKDGSQEVSVYPQIAWNASKLYEDVDGDNLVDKIKLNSSWFKNYRLNKILTREYNLETHEAEFDKADRELKEQIRKAEK